MRQVFALLAVSMLLAGLSPAEGAENLSVVSDFTLGDYRGREYKLSEFEKQPVVVVAFLGIECPLAKQYSVRLQELAKEYADKGVTFLGVDANSQDAPTEIAAFVRRQGLEYPFLIDVGSKLAEQMGATRTPEVVVLDQNRSIRYRGRIDDQFQIGVIRDKADRQELRDALDSLLAGKAVAVPQTTPIGCLIGRPQSPTEKPTVTWSKEIVRIFQKRCQECHREGDIGPFALSDYEEAAGWGDMIREVVRENRMPPWHASPEFGHFSNARLLPAEEKQAILTWVREGCPQGDPADLPEPRTFTKGWQLSREPDAVFQMAEAYPVPADAGKQGVKYQNFWVDPQLTEDKWLAQAEVVPGAPAVVHHIIVYMHPDKENRRQEVFLTAYVPGLRVRPIAPGYAKRIPAGSQLRFQVHYTPNGTATLDQSKVGLIYADPATVTNEVVTTEAVNTRFQLEPFKDDQVVHASTRKSPRDVEMLTMSPHMHLRGKSFRFQLKKPDGTLDTLLDVPRFDFNWQTSYELAEPITLPAGSQIVCTASFDNSEDNLNNPDPSKRVKWGDQSWDEMMIGYFDIVVPRTDKAAGKIIGPGIPDDTPFAQMDVDKDGVVSRDEAKVHPLLSQFYDVVDADKSGDLDIEELGKALKMLKAAGGQPKK
ncbi:Thiol-disulfide oxidoreductase ResA [Caulifigura coniformis]|uniref:Thiol-disulfide oxidoreductase ResA n=1 Tax=Caulifigura coniformis TaxID=2527983 RepID=A0A517S9S3_9PLAN|nr:redoxin domain-containing protein [Caulifigura coniformis]QDT52880.1 Thiol-disulfide oxidoreductase ResA [Caulifigura coniformis]